MQFSIIIPLDFHRSRALDCIHGWVETQRMPAKDFELICLLPSDDPDKLGDLIRPLLRPHDRLMPCDAHHDMDLCAHGAALSNGTYLFFTESHVWPEHDVLFASKQVFDDHPDWAAFSCRTARVAPNRLARLEADLYEHDIDQAMIFHPWRKILDQCFVTRSDAYRAAGGFDPDLGHFAEWALAARYYDHDLTIGYAPHIVLNHFYSGDITEWRRFTNSFVEGEMRFCARGGDRDRLMRDDTPPEWTQRGNWNRRFARSLTTCLCKSLRGWPRHFRSLVWLPAIVRWSTVAACGVACSQRAADIMVAWRRAELFFANIIATEAQLAGCYDRFVRALIHARRLRELTRQAALERPPAVAEFAPGDHRLGDIAAGFHLVETVDGMPMRWSEPVAVVALAVTRASRSIVIECARVRSLLADPPPRFFINEVRVPRGAITLADNRAVITLDRTTVGVVRLAWICLPLKGDADRRQLGLPILRIAVEDQIEGFAPRFPSSWNVRRANSPPFGADRVGDVGESIIAQQTGEVTLDRRYQTGSVEHERGVELHQGSAGTDFRIGVGAARHPAAADDGNPSVRSAIEFAQALRRGLHQRPAG
jgi:hypothetical protein